MKARNIANAISIILIIVSATLLIIKNIYWYYPATIGVWFMFDSFSHLRGSKTTLDLLINKKYSKFLTLFLLLFVFGIIIELAGKFWLNLWIYNGSQIVANTANFIVYPFAMMSFREMFKLISSFIKNNAAATAVSMIAGVVIWEFPNLHAHYWTYDIPFGFALFNINIIVILGWSIFIIGTNSIYNILKIK